jgi:poly-gamma-glutamate synthesis protein (capsule biosynthesis protein)
MKLQKRRLRRWLWVVIVLVVGLLFSIGALALWGYNHQQRKAQTTQKVQPPAPKPIAITTNTAYFGDMYWGRYMNEWSMASPLKEAYPFSRLGEFNRENYDAWIVNLECPTVPGLKLTAAQEEANLSFNCSPDYLPEVAKWFTAVSLANNHTDNQGAAGFVETQKQLDKVGIQYFGHYDPIVKEDACEVIALPVRVTQDDGAERAGKIPIALCGYNGVFKIPSEASLAIMEEYSKYMPVLSMPHMGTEYKPTPDTLKQRTYRSMIDHGADMVLGGHPHWVQTTESYKGHPIIYSMGNFIFDQQGNAEVERSASINVVMNVATADSELLEKWLTLGESCAAYKDDCLQQAAAQNLEKLPFTFKLGVIGGNSGSKITKPATAAQQTAILDRLQWGATMNQLQAPYSSL